MLRSQVLFFMVLGAGVIFLSVLLYFTADIQFQRACIKVIRRLLKTVALRQARPSSQYRSELAQHMQCIAASGAVELAEHLVSAAKLCSGHRSGQACSSRQQQDDGQQQRFATVR